MVQQVVSKGTGRTIVIRGPARAGSGDAPQVVSKGTGRTLIIRGPSRTIAGGSSTLAGLTDTTIATQVAGHGLYYTGATWANSARDQIPVHTEASGGFRVYEDSSGNDIIRLNNGGAWDMFFGNATENPYYYWLGSGVCEFNGTTTNVPNGMTWNAAAGDIAFTVDAGNYTISTAAGGFLSIFGDNQSAAWTVGFNNTTRTWVKADTTTGDYGLTLGNTTDDPWIDLVTSGELRINGSAGTSGQIVGSQGTGLPAQWTTPGVAWGAVTGTLSDQTDLQSALDAKQGTALTTDSILVGVAGAAAELAAGTEGYALKIVSGSPAWAVAGTFDPEDVTIAAASATAFRVHDGTSNWILANTTGNTLQFGNATDNNAHEFLGTGMLTTGGDVTITGDAVVFNGGGSFAIGAGTAPTGADSLCIGGGVASAGAYADAVVIGDDATIGGQRTAVLGSNVYAATNGCSVGYSCFANSNCSSFGYDGYTTGSSVGVGYSHYISGTNGTGIGFNVDVRDNYSIGIGAGATTDTANQCVIGSTGSNRVTLFVFGGGHPSETAPSTSVTWRTANASGTDVAAPNLVLQPGFGTGNAASGSLSVVTGDVGGSGATLQTGTTKLEVDATGVGFHGVTPVAQSSAYTPTNVSTDRAYDADSTSTAEIADVLGTLISDLQATGLIG